MMSFYSGKDGLMCKLFPSSLGEAGLLWFDRLPRGSISSLRDLSTAFQARFITSTKVKKEVDSLLGLRRARSESLRQYAARYWDLYNEIKDCDQKIVATSFKLGLDHTSREFEDLVLFPPSSMNELMARIELHAKLEEAKSERSRADQRQSAGRSDNHHTQVIRKETNTVQTGDRRPPKPHEFVAHTTTFKEPLYILLRKD